MMAKTTKPKQSQKKASNYYDWADDFAREAKRDADAEIIRHLEYMDLPVAPEDFISVTKQLVGLCAAGIGEKGRSVGRFLAKQKYRLNGYNKLHYCVTVEIARQHYGRIICDEKFSQIDLVDLHNNVWWLMKAVGFTKICISRLDGAYIDDCEYRDIEKHIESDFYFDYERNQLEIYLDRSFLLDDTLTCHVLEHQTPVEIDTDASSISNDSTDQSR